jgi:hypothetical protein
MSGLRKSANTTLQGFGKCAATATPPIPGRMTVTEFDVGASRCTP